MHKFFKKRFTLSLPKGFTLIELLVVIAIISILISVGSVSYIRAIRLSRDSKRQTDIEQLRQALETYRSQNLTYPGNINSLVPDFISEIPTDPKAPFDSYDYSPGGSIPITTYQLCATTESPEPAQYCKSQP